MPLYKQTAPYRVMVHDTATISQLPVADERSIASIVRCKLTASSKLGENGVLSRIVPMKVRSS